jgi:thiol-disulfide isomerase/thioredoxin
MNKTKRIKVVMLILLVSLTFFTCKKKTAESQISNNIVVNLERRGGDTPVSISTRTFKFLDTIKFKEFKGLIKNDSSFIVYLDIFDMSKLNKLRDNNLKNNEQYNFINSKLYCLTGFKNGLQYYCIDANFNKDFSDDIFKKFNKSISSQIFDDYKIRDTFDILKIEVDKLENDIFYKDTLYLKVYPDIKSISFKNETSFEKFQHSLVLHGATSNYLYGEFLVSNDKYKVAIDNNESNGIMLFNKKDSLFKKKFSDFYFLKDTLKLKDAYYSIESMTRVPAKLNLKKLDIIEEKNGFRQGEFTKNYSIENLKGGKSNFKEVLGNKKYLLIDFWGTWCGPCKDLTPDIVVLHKEYKDNISFMSLAFEKDIKPVIDYVEKNKMDWFNGIIKGVPKSNDKSNEIISGLRIECYPTFMLLNRDLKIVYRNCGGGSGFTDLKMFLNKYNDI